VNKKSHSASHPPTLLANESNAHHHTTSPSHPRYPRSYRFPPESGRLCIKSTPLTLAADTDRLDEYKYRPTLHMPASQATQQMSVQSLTLTPDEVQILATSRAVRPLTAERASKYVSYTNEPRNLFCS
jgi:hypothetical protein